MLRLFLIPVVGFVAAATPTPTATPVVWTTVASMPTARAGLAAATGSDGRIYAIGGSNNFSTANLKGAGLTTVEAYTPASGRWATVASMPTARSGLAAATGSDGRIYAIGGYSSKGVGVSSVDAYTPSTNRWATVAPLPTARGGLAAATGSDGRIYAIGGYDNNGVGVSSVDAYTPSTNSWATVASMPTPRGGLAAAAGPDGRIYAIGGSSSTAVDVKGAGLATVEAYTPATNKWATVASIPIGRVDLAGATGADGRIYAIAGFIGYGLIGGRPYDYVEAYAPATNSWTTVDRLPIPTGWLAAAVGSDRRIYAIGGDDSGPPAERGDPLNFAWGYETTPLTTPSPSATPRSVPARSPSSGQGQALVVTAIVIPIVVALALVAAYFVRRRPAGAVVNQPRSPPPPARTPSGGLAKADAPASPRIAPAAEPVPTLPSDALSAPAMTRIGEPVLVSQAEVPFVPAVAASGHGSSARVFMSYRREDSSGYAGRLFDALVARFGERSVFMDIDTLTPGQDFVQVIEDALADCEIVLVLIGRHWLNARDRRNRRRLDNPDDFVRLEIEGALLRKLHVLPVLVGGAEMPSSRDLPASLAALTRRHAFEVSDHRWRYDVQALLAALVVQSRDLDHPLAAEPPMEPDQPGTE